MAHSGLLFSNRNGDGSDELTALPLEEMKVRAQIVDVTAKVTLVQKFYNPSPVSTGRAKYCFPVPASAAICGFQMICSDGRTIKGECKVKEEARDIYEQGVAGGQTAALMEYVTDDVFVISVGAFPPRAVIETRVVYVQPLHTGDYVDQVQFYLPKHVGERYGYPPPGLEGALQPSFSETRISVTVDIQTYGRINEITSPSHGDTIAETKYSTHLGRPSKRRTTIRYRSPQYLERDFVLCIFAQGLDKPRCFAEVWRDPRLQRPDSLALQLTIVPRHKLPAVQSQEYIFLIDRSGSMDGERIRIAREVMVMMLRMIPASGSTFNIFSFGSSCKSCFPKSQRYGQATMETATSYASSMAADLGGTEICAALEEVTSACSQVHIPTVVFVLTDGEAWNVAECQDVARRFVSRSNASRRIFTLGIGESVSTAMCEGIASAGNGECLLALDPSSIVQKCAKLFTAGRTPFLREISLDWGISNETIPSSASGVSFLNQPSTKAAATRHLPEIQQVPHTIPSIHSGTRMTVFALVHSKKLQIPQSVTLSGVLDDESKTNFRFTVDIHETSLLQTDSQKIPMIHTMAAWKLAQQYNEDPSVLPESVDGTTAEEFRHSVVTQFGLEYQLVTPYTSFVAVDGLEDTQSGKKLETSFLSRHPELIPDIDEPPDGPSYTTSAHWTVINSILSIPTAVVGAMGSWLSTLGGGLANLPFMNSAGSEMPLLPPRSASRHSQGHWRQSRDEVETDMDGLEDIPADSFPPEGSATPSDSSSVRSLSSLSSFRSYRSDGSYWSSNSSYFSNELPPSIPPSPQLMPQVVESSRGVRSPTPDIYAPPPVPDNIVKLVQFQHFDGSFAMNPDIESILGPTLVQARQALTRDEQAVWTTICCIAYLKALLADNPDLLENLLIKPMDFLQSKRNVEVDRLVSHAMSLLQS